ncbi:MAG: LysM peptidoglycan-binding domain-containing protein [Chthoniobacterales bacterium]
MKIRLPKLTLFKKHKGKKMRATVTRRPMRAATASYDEMAEPNMKLSRALLIVLLLHVVAVSGIIAFNAIKTRQGPALPQVKKSATTNPAKSESTGVSSNTTEEDKTKALEIRPAKAVGKQSSKDHGKAGDAKRDESHKTYTIGKGDTPVSIAKKFKVSYDDLLALNHIEDPRKLKIGQKLLIPNRAAKGKKTDE